MFSAIRLAIKLAIRRDRGSMAAEFVIAAPLLVLLMLLVSAGGEWISMSGNVTAAARDAARAASFARSGADADADARQAAQGDLKGICHGGGPQTSVVPVGGTGGFATATDVRVTVSCVADLAAFRDVGFPVSHPFSDTVTVALDPFVERGD